MRESVAIVVVLYKAEMSVYHERLLEDEMVTLVVVDNTPDRDLALKKDRLIYVPLQRNMGIATAQNEGIRQAECLGCDYIIFFDQDSKIPERYSEGIIEEYKRIEQLIPNLFLLGPTIINGRTEEEYKSTIHKDIWMTEDFIRRREIISSGSCVSLRKIEEVGLNDDSMFIDYVDHEWCWRAESKGFVNGITLKIKLAHFVGQQEYRIFNQLVIISAPIRYYYQTRNYLWLLRRSYVPRQWKINHGIKLMIYPISFPFKVRCWRAIYVQMFRGLKDGLLNKRYGKSRSGSGIV